MDLHEFSDLSGAKLVHSTLNEGLYLRFKLECLRDIFGQLPEVIELPCLHCLKLLLQDPLEENEEFLLLSFTGKSAVDVNSVDGVSQAQILRPEVEQVLLNARIFGVEDGSCEGVHHRDGELESFL